MGHERIGFLPKTKPWQTIINQLASYDGDKNSVWQIATSTLDAIRKTYESVPYDESVANAIMFLAKLSYSAKVEDQTKFLIDNGYTIDSSMSLFSLMVSAQELIKTENGSLEINKFAKDAAMQAVIDYQEQHRTEQLSLFTKQPKNIWSDVGTGAAFCEMTRCFFASFTERQLKYYLERVAASSIDNYGTLQLFSQRLSEQSNAISKHAFEISKLVQSFSAGWFNAHGVHSVPTKEQLESFLRISFGKLREEFRREAEGK